MGNEGERLGKEGESLGRWRAKLFTGSGTRRKTQSQGAGGPGEGLGF